jgi:hypothetical protein
VCRHSGALAGHASHRPPPPRQPSFPLATTSIARQPHSMAGRPPVPPPAPPVAGPHGSTSTNSCHPGAQGWRHSMPQHQFSHALGHMHHSEPARRVGGPCPPHSTHQAVLLSGQQPSPPTAVHRGMHSAPGASPASTPQPPPTATALGPLNPAPHATHVANIHPSHAPLCSLRPLLPGMLAPQGAGADPTDGSAFRNLPPHQPPHAMQPQWQHPHSPSPRHDMRQPPRPWGAPPR